MRRSLRLPGLILSLLLLPMLAAAGNVYVRALTFFAKESVTVGATSIGLTVATFAPAGQSAASYAFITVETDQARCHLHGAAADTTGHLFNVGDAMELHGTNTLAQLRCIRVTTDATLRVSYARP